MLVLSRKKDENVQTILDEATLENLLSQVRASGQPIVLKYTVVEIRGDKVRLGVDAPREVPVHRGEVITRIEQGS
jgi:sRNA-binding carbon storage regulator CsrA